MAKPTDPKLAEVARQLVRAYRLARSATHRLRRGTGWTQRDAADWWGVSERQWRRYETGPGMPPLALMKRIAKHPQGD